MTMTIFPLPLTQILGHWGAYVVFLLIGFSFGFVLESAGFGNSKKLAAQFYFKDMTVLKVMFGAIIVAMVLIFGASAVGLLDYNLIWVNPTYLWPGIVGGLIMGAGFIIGGFCPGTSLVGAATLKLDAIFFALGVLYDDKIPDPKRAVARCGRRPQHLLASCRGRRGDHRPRLARAGTCRNCRPRERLPLHPGRHARALRPFESQRRAGKGLLETPGGPENYGQNLKRLRRMRT